MKFFVYLYYIFELAQMGASLILTFISSFAFVYSFEVFTIMNMVILILLYKHYGGNKRQFNRLS